MPRHLQQCPVEPGMRIGRYVIQKPLIATSGAWIFDAECDDDPTPAVFKLVNGTISNILIEREICANCALAKCPNAVIGSDFVTINGLHGFFMPKCEGGDLCDLVNEATLTEDEIAPMAFRIVEALDYLHRQGFVHCDVKPDNIFLSTGGPVRETFLGDFGLATRCAPGAKIRMRTGSRAYLSPERLEERPFDHAVDMWAFGVTLFNMASSRMPFPNYMEDPDWFEYAVTFANWDQDLLVTLERSEALIDLVDRCLVVNPEERMTAEHALEHPFFARVRGTRKADIEKEMGEEAVPEEN
jgi:serine/threonine protein kinase